MAQFSLRDFRKHASFFLRDRLNDARLALTDVSRIQLLAEEATNDDPWGPESKTMAMLADAAFELEEYERITQVIHSRLDGGKQRPWRQLHKTLVLLEYLLIRGPVSVGKEFRGDILQFEDLSETDFADKHGGSKVRKAVDRVLELLNDPALWKEERIRATKLSFGIHGFGNNAGKVPCADDTQWGDQNSEENMVPSPKTPLDVEGNNADKLCMVPSDKPPSVSNQAGRPKQIGFMKEQKVSPRSFRKSLSNLVPFKERVPYLGRQTVPDEDGSTDGEEVSMCLLDEEEDIEPASQQVAQVEATEGARQLVTC